MPLNFATDTTLNNTPDETTPQSSSSIKPLPQEALSSHVPILSAEDVGEILHLSKNAIDWMNKEPVDDQSLLLVLDYTKVFVNLGHNNTNKDAVTNALIEAGGLHIDENMFKFVSWELMYQARKQMKNTMTWLFYDLSGTQARYCNGQWIPYGQQQTIHTTVITWFPEPANKRMVIPFEFFSVG